MMHVGLPPRSNRSDGLLVAFTQDFGRQDQFAKVGVTENGGLAAEEVVDLVRGPQVECHLRRERVEPLLVVLRQSAARP
jgi:hypothetical protein